MLIMIKRIVKRIVYPHHYDNDAYVAFLRAGGAKIGDGTFFYEPKSRPVDETSLPFIEIGRNCRITAGVTILAHDYSYAVLRPLYHSMLMKTGMTKIGDNVFIGMRSIIMMNVTIGDNVVIGAGSVVTKDIPSDCIAAGNPASVICTMEEYHQKCLERFEEGAVIRYERLKGHLGRDIEETDMGWYIALWHTKHKEDILRTFRVDGDDTGCVIRDVLNYPERYPSFEAFKTHHLLK